MTTIDARGMSCPEPAMRTRRALDEAKAGIVEVLVDNETSRDNVTRCGRKAQWEASVEDLPDGCYKVVFKKW